MKVPRAPRGVPRRPFHVLLDAEQWKKLTTLAKKARRSCADVIRKLLSEAA